MLERLIKGLKTIENTLPFSRDSRLGWLTFCPTNLGTTVRASVHIRLPKISAKPDFKKTCDELKLQVNSSVYDAKPTTFFERDVSFPAVFLAFQYFNQRENLHYFDKSLFKLLKTLCCNGNSHGTAFPTAKILFL